MVLEKPSEEFIEQKITKQVTVTAGTSEIVSINIPRNRKIFLKGYGYTWFTSNTYILSTGNISFPARSDQEGSPAIPVMFGTPFKCRSGSNLHLTISNGDSVDHTYDVVFYIVSEELLEIESTGGDLNLTVGGSGGAASAVTIYNVAKSVGADVTSDGLEVFTDKALPAGTNTIGAVTHAAPTTLLDGTLTTSGAIGEALAASTACQRVTIQADVNNTDAVFIGNSTSQNVRLDIGQSVDIEIDNLAKIFIKRNGASNQTVNYIGS